MAIYQMGRGWPGHKYALNCSAPVPGKFGAPSAKSCVTLSGRLAAGVCSDISELALRVAWPIVGSVYDTLPIAG